AVPLESLDRQLHALYVGLATAAVIALAAGGTLCYLLARRNAVPVVELTRFSNALARGDLEPRILRADHGQIGSLASSLNRTADCISRLMHETQRDRAELLAVLSSMTEGVIATDGQQRILHANTAAASLLDLGEQLSQGRLLWEVVRSEPLLRAAVDVQD